MNERHNNPDPPATVSHSPQNAESEDSRKDRRREGDVVPSTDTDIANAFATSTISELEHLTRQFYRACQNAADVDELPDFADFLPEITRDAAKYRSAFVALLELEVAQFLQAGCAIPRDKYASRFPQLESLIDCATANARKHQIECLPPEGYGRWLPWPGQRVDKYRMAGGCGEVRIAEADRCFARRVVVKTIQPQYLESPNHVERFQREAEIIAALNHPGIPPIYDYGTLNEPVGAPYYSMRLVEGNTFEDILRRARSERRFQDELPRHIDIIRSIAEAVAYAHEQRIIHRDLKPGNVIVGKFGEVQVLDWGSGKRLDDVEITETDFAADAENSILHSLGDAPGTLPYMSPEHAHERKEELRPASDVFSMGSMLCEVLVGRPAFFAATRKELITIVRDADLSLAHAQLNEFQNQGEIDSDLVAICRKCLEIRPEDRFADCGQLVNRLNQYQTSLETRLQQERSARIAEESRQFERRVANRKRVKWIAGVLILGCSLCVVLGYFYLDHRQRQSELHVDEQRQQSALSVTLAQMEQQTSDLLKEGASYDQFSLLNSDLTSWAVRLEKLRQRLDQAEIDLRNLEGRFGEEPSHIFRNRFQAADDLHALLSADLALAREVEAIRAGNIVAFDAGDDPYLEKRNAYRRLFQEHLVQDPSRSTAASISIAVNDSRTPWLWLSVCDGYATTLTQQKTTQRSLRRKMREVGITIDFDDFRNSVRRLEHEDFSDRDGFQNVLMDRRVYQLPTELLIAVVAGMKLQSRGDEALVLLESAAFRRGNYFLWFAIGVEAADSDLLLAERAFTAALSLRPSSYMAAHELARVYFQQSLRAGNAEQSQVLFDRAENFFKRSLQAAAKTAEPPDDVAVIHYNLATDQEYMATFIVDEARKKLVSRRRAIQEADKESTRLIDSAIQSYRLAIELNPNFDSAWNNMGIIFSGRGQSAKAEHAYRQAIEVNQSNDSAWVNLGIALRHQEKLEEAKHCYQRATEVNPNRPEAWEGLGIVNKELEDYGQAVEAYTQAIGAARADGEVDRRKKISAWQQQVDDCRAVLDSTEKQ